jgi:hypothetical protein
MYRDVQACDLHFNGVLFRAAVSFLATGARTMARLPAFRAVAWR